MTKQEKIERFNQILFHWHKTHYRPMPWRNTRDPYRILVSEVMLQQTQVERVRAKYAEFIKKFPTIRTLSEASLGDVIRVWSGLGYNRRAKYLHECAKEIVARHNRRFPKDEEALRALPGIGISTAAAIRAFAFGFDEPMIDTNIRRVLVRTFFKKRIPSNRELFEFAATIIPKGKGREWNYALLDLGATLCTARSHSPDCPLIPLHGTVGDFVYKKPQTKFKHSKRYYRGRIVELLRRKKEGITRPLLRKILGSAPFRFEDILSGLIKNGLVVTVRGKISLP